MNKRNGLILGLLLGILILEIIILAPQDVGLRPDEDQALQKAPAPENRQGQVMQDAHLVEAKGGQKEWELWARKALQPNEGANWTIENVKVKFFGDNGVYYTVTGERGTVVYGNAEMKDMKISGNVVTRSSNGYVFRTDEVIYNSAQRLLTSPHAVSMKGPKDPKGDQLSLTGEDMKANMTSNEIEVAKDVRARMQIKGDRTATISSTRALFSGRSNFARFLGNVVIDIDTLRITGPTAQFNYKPGGNDLESVLVSGGVKVTDIDKMATSENVSVSFNEDKFVFRGAPRVVQSGDELRGDEIVFMDGGKKVRVSNAKAKVDPKSLEEAEKKN